MIKASIFKAREQSGETLAMTLAFQMRLQVGCFPLAKSSASPFRAL